MSNVRKYRRFLWILLGCSLLLCAGCLYFAAQSSIPDEISVYEGQEAQLDDVLPSPVFTYDEDIAVLGSNQYQLKCRLFGMVPLKTVKVQSIPRQSVYVSGETIGIYMETEGVMIIDAGEIDAADEVTVRPAENIVKSGDYILEVNGKKIENKKELMDLVADSSGEEMQLLLKRGLERITVALDPVLTKDGSYKLGIWVRDNIQGIGTLTFIKNDGTFGALGHGISDIDTGELLQLSEGQLYSAKILSVSKGARGNPGELKGVITYQDEEKLGSITVNQYNGIGGQLNSKGKQTLTHQQMEIGLKQEVTTGPATILCNVDGEVKEYQTEITEISYEEEESNKNFVIHVTDERLLGSTGGIVQGMSGSPVIQNHKLVGAVTHVFVQDATRGYGIFAENMLQ
ncbi:MAG: SpoIVB peptidase [Ruminococcus sp.]